jgi:hypothetical protein
MHALMKKLSPLCKVFCTRKSSVNSSPAAVEQALQFKKRRKFREVAVKFCYDGPAPVAPELPPPSLLTHGAKHTTLEQSKVTGRVKFVAKK